MREINKETIERAHKQCDLGRGACNGCVYSLPLPFKCLIRVLLGAGDVKIYLNWSWDSKTILLDSKAEHLLKAWALYKIGLHKIPPEQLKVLRDWEEGIDPVGTNADPAPQADPTGTERKNEKV